MSLYLNYTYTLCNNTYIPYIHDLIWNYLVFSLHYLPTYLCQVVDEGLIIGFATMPKYVFNVGYRTKMQTWGCTYLLIYFSMINHCFQTEVWKLVELTLKI